MSNQTQASTQDMQLANMWSAFNQVSLLSTTIDGTKNIDSID
jgi:hypothetical protein